MFRQLHLIDGLLYFYSAEYAFRQLHSIDGFDILTRACLLSKVLPLFASPPPFLKGDQTMQLLGIGKKVFGCDCCVKGY